MASQTEHCQALQAGAGALKFLDKSNGHDVDNREAEQVHTELSQLRANQSARNTVRLLTWNVFNGITWQDNPLPLEKRYELFSLRFEAVVAQIVKNSPTVIFLQEVPPSQRRYVEKRLEMGYLAGYDRGFEAPAELDSQSDDSLMVFVQQWRVQPYDAAKLVGLSPNEKATGFTGKSVYDDELEYLHQAQVTIDDIRVGLYNVHFWATKKSRKDRQRVFLDSLARMVRGQADLSLLAGDPNLRDDEAEESLALINSEQQLQVSDAFFLAGSPREVEFTWDTRANKVLPVPGEPRFRFDRVYVLTGAGPAAPVRGSVSSPSSFGLDSFTLVGQSKMILPGNRKIHPSDHWGVLTEWSPSDSSRHTGSNATSRSRKGAKGAMASAAGLENRVNARNVDGSEQGKGGKGKGNSRGKGKGPVKMRNSTDFGVDSAKLRQQHDTRSGPSEESDTKLDDWMARRMAQTLKISGK